MILRVAQQKSELGIFHTNEDYKLQGKGNDIEQKKGETAYTQIDDIPSTFLQTNKRTITQINIQQNNSLQ